MDKRLLDILCCPITHQPLRMLSRSELELLNRAVGTGELVHEDGSVCNDRATAALMTCDGRRIYRVEEDIPVMLAELSIASADVEGMSCVDG